MRVILDTNVFVSGVFFGGPPYRILKAWRDGELQMVVSGDILDEYRRVGKALSEQFPAIALGSILDFVAAKAEMCTAQVLPAPVCVDPDDDKFIACALTAEIKIIVSGDKHLLRLNGYRGVSVLKPREFVDTYLSEPEKF